MFMNTVLIIVIVVVLVAGAASAGYFLIQPAKNSSMNVTNNTTANDTAVNNTTSNASSSSGNQQQNQTDQNRGLISAAEAQAIANNYLNSHSKYVNFDAGVASLHGTVYFVPMVINNDNAQSAKGTVVGNVKIDGNNGAVLGIQTWDIETNAEINEPP